MQAFAIEVSHPRTSMQFARPYRSRNSWERVAVLRETDDLSTTKLEFARRAPTVYSVLTFKYARLVVKIN